MEDIERLYNPLTAFGNRELISTLHRIEAELAERKARQECGLCDERGMVEVDCDQCEGTGRVTVPCEHE